ncbi:hypothetical protein Cni_G27158 [Canna indica]|uniref:PX domain-containing protein n=1 Tax=Canna indica TaxID=4628 RepID=A0AAQ3L080_9LILI|nr:hypothetical protein Cni_G27158 [Canna indica]
MEAGSPPAAPPDPFDEFFPQHQGHASDADDDDASSPFASSNYSSFDGEGSELERYCSANSALGSASLCSSVGNYGDLLDFSDAAAWDRLNRSSDEGVITSPRERDLPAASLDRMGSFPRVRSPSRLHPASADRLEESMQLEEVEGQQETVSSDGNVDVLPHDGISAGRGDGSHGKSSLLCKIASAEAVDLLGNLGSCSRAESRAMIDADEGTSSGCEHSEGENSMLEYGTDRENLTGLYEKESSGHIDKIKCNNVNPLFMNSSIAFGSDDLDELLQENGVLDLHGLSLYQDQSDFQQSLHAKDERNIPSLTINHVIEPHNDAEKEENAIDVSPVSYQIQDYDQQNQEGIVCSIRNPPDHYEASHKDKLLPLEHTVENQSKCMNKVPIGGIYSIDNEIIEDVDVHEVAEKRMFSVSGSTQHETTIHISCVAGVASQNERCLGQEHDKPRISTSVISSGENSSFQIEFDKTSKIKDLEEENIVTDEIKKQDAAAVYDEMVMEMEEILLDTGKSTGTRSGGNHGYPNQSHHFRDGSSTASTSGTDDVYAPAQYHSKIDRVEVIGAKQRIGDVSFGERLVGVKEYTVYILRVWSANDQWEVERRYRDFFALYQQLRTLFFDHGLSLPSQWAFVDRESMKFFGNVSPIVVSKRSALIQDCLRSVLSSGYPFGFPGPLLFFLSPGKVAYNSSLLKALVPQSIQKLGEGWNSKFSTSGDSPEDITELGRTISLVVDIKPRKSMQQLLELQHYTCAGCHRHLDAGKTFLRELVQTLAWKKPRFCEYTGQLFCASCHTNDTAVLPAKVLHLWDFSLYPVSQFAKAYLESIYDQPMLCVSAMNPFLFNKVPALLHIMGIRKKIAAMFPYIRCPFRISIQRGLGSRRHFLECNDFFALRDLVDLSKGAFAALPIMLETVSNKILEHITQQCLVCYDAGVPCAARQVCDDPLSLIFPFQEAEAARCSSCESIFHKPCFVKIISCPCGKPTGANRSSQGHGDSMELLDDGLIEPSDSHSTSNLFSNILLKARPDRIWKPRNRSPVILMGSLPNTSL